jgi:hypothetical protein
VSEQRAARRVLLVEVLGGKQAQVCDGAEGGVVDVVRSATPSPFPSRASLRPAGRDELERLPMARSQLASPSITPPSVAAMCRVPDVASSARQRTTSLKSPSASMRYPSSRSPVARDIRKMLGANVSEARHNNCPESDAKESVGDCDKEPAVAGKSGGRFIGVTDRVFGHPWSSISADCCCGLEGCKAPHMVACVGATA